METVRGRRLLWRIGEVVEARSDTPSTKSLILEVPGWGGHKAGQHVDVRLTALDGYQALRSYSIASAPEDGRLELVIERLEDGEVSPYLTDELRVGDRLELRGPIGGWFTWEAREGGPAAARGWGIGHSTAHVDDPSPGCCRERHPDPSSLLFALLRRGYLRRRA